MSQRALLLAVADHLQKSGPFGMALSHNECDVNVDGQPPGANAGDFYVSVWPTSWSARRVEGLYEVFGVAITVSLRNRGIARDRWGRELLCKEKNGLIAICEALRVHMHLDVNADDILNRANDYIGPASEVNGFVEPLILVDGGRCEVKTGRWWHGTANDEESGGLSQTLQFAEAGRAQHIEEMT